MSTPNSQIYLCSGVPLDSTYEHTIYFESKGYQEAYFLGKAGPVLYRYSFLRPEHKVKVSGDFADAYKWNYLFFKNADGKWFYHFINKVEYVNENTVELTIELDVIQTFMFDWNLHKCLIERTHTPSDDFGEHTIPEGLETGPLMVYSNHDVCFTDCYIMMLASCGVTGSGVWGSMYGGAYSGLACYAVEPAELYEFDKWLDKASSSEEPFIDAIVAMWMYPKQLVNVGLTLLTATGGNPVIHQVLNVKTYEYTVTDPFKLSFPNGQMPETVNGVTIYNRKSLCYPFTQLYVTNNAGGCATFHRERFTEPDEFTFKFYGALSPESGVKMAPVHYNKKLGDTVNYEEGINLPPFPTCAWNSDVYKVWLAQNMASQQATIQQAKVDTFLGVASMVGGVVAGVATGNAVTAVGGVVAGVSALKNQHNVVQNIMAQRQDMSTQPEQARGLHSANIDLANGRMGFSFRWMCPTEEYFQAIDDYFTHYGYRVNQFAVPNLKNRYRFTYIKTAGAMVTGPFSSEHQHRIQDIFDHGITFWADYEGVGDYDTRNDLL